MRTVWSISWVTFFWTTSSVMVVSILPVYLSEELKISNTGIGLLDGIAIAAAFIAKVYAGIFSDLSNKRKPFLITGSIFTLLTKPLFALASSWALIFSTKFIDRLGKGLRSAPTDALIADVTERKSLSNAFGIRQALHALGGIAGAVSAMLLLSSSYFSFSYKEIFFIASIPATIALFIIVYIIKEPKPINKIKRKKLSYNLKDIKNLPNAYWFILVITGLLMLARFSEAFMVLKAKSLGWELKYLPFMVVVIEFFHMIFAFLNKKLTEKYGKVDVLLFGLVLLILADFVFVIANSSSFIIFGIIFSGMHMGVTQGILRSMVAHCCSRDLFGTAFAMFYLVCGFSVLIGNYMAGYLSDKYNLSAAFVGGMLATSLSFIFLFIVKFKLKQNFIIPVTVNN